MRSEDLDFADSLRALAGWNQTLDDWKRFLSFDPNGSFIAEWDGVPAGTATTISYGTELAWIGMVLVHPNFRRRGIATGLLKHCVEYLQTRGVRCIKLDATPAGQEVYLRLGFKKEWDLTRWSGLWSGEGASRRLRVHEWTAIRIEALDARAFGVSRTQLLNALASQSQSAVVVESDDGSLAYGMIRSGSRQLYLGPAVAESETAGQDLIQTLLANCEGNALFWDIPDANAAATTLTKRHGFQPQRSLTRMYLGQNVSADSRMIFGIAGPDLG
jgi:GNAT superfamily N-acetyltransferase